MIKTSLNRWAFGSDVGYSDCFRLAKKYQLDAVELNLEETGDFALDTNARELRSIRDSAGDHGVEISSICSLLFWKYPITSRDRAVRKRGTDLIVKMIDCAAELGVSVILVVPGMVHADPPLNFGNPPIPYAEAYKTSLFVIKELASHARAKGVTIGLENVFFNKLLVTQMEYGQFLDEVNSDNVKLYLDLGNTMMCGFPEDWINYLGSRICQVHVKDFDKKINTLYGWKNIFEGDVNWPLVVQALRGVAYRGYLVGEPSLAPFTYHPEELVKTTASRLARLKEMLD